MTHVLGAKSRANLIGVAPQLAALIPLALARCPVDFGIAEKQVRTVAEQREKVRQGVSKTMKSRHLVRPDGFGHAVDLVPWVDGKFQWGDNQWRVRTAAGVMLEPFFDIAAAMQEVAIEKDVSLIWGAVWDQPLNRLPRGAKGKKAALQAYKVRHPGPDFVDGPHFELA